MTQKVTENDTVIRTECREAEGCVLQYRLILRRGVETAYDDPLYSVKVAMKYRDQRTAEAEIRDGFSDSDKAFRFFNCLCKDCVTPIDLRYVYEDEMLR